jgi:hypothetical protein
VFQLILIILLLPDLQSKPAHIPAVEVDPPGCSFNPTHESHQVVFREITVPLLLGIFVLLWFTAKNSKNFIV